MKYWLVATYNLNDIRKLESNLSNQNFEYYLPKISIKKINSAPKDEILFPGYVFIYTDMNKYSKLKYTKGLKDIIKFGTNISYLTDNEIKSIRIVEKLSKNEPVLQKIEIGQEALIVKGSFKGTIVKICSLPHKKRVDVLMNLLGSSRKVSLTREDLLF